MIKFLFLFVFSLQLHAADWPRVVEDVCQSQGSYAVFPVYGGASNVNYKISVEGCDYFLRFAPQKQEDLFADLAVEYEVLSSLAALGVAPKPVYYDDEKKGLVTQFVEQDRGEVDLLEPATRKSVFALLHAIEDSKIVIDRSFEPYKQTMHLVAQTDEKYEHEFEQRFGSVLKRIDQYLAKNPKKTLCHLDLHHKNILRGPNQFLLVDWEYAMMSHPFLVLASMASIERWNDAQMEQMLADYMGAYTKDDSDLLYLYRIAIDLFWTAWNEVQSRVSTINNPYDVWKQLFELAARERIASDRYASIMNVDVILLFGPPGSGKGTFSQFAASRGYAHIGAGDLVREEVYNKTALGIAIKDIVEKGDPIDPAIMFNLVKAKALYYTEQHIPFIIDGYGRTPEDAAMLRQLLKELGVRVQVVFLDASDATCKERILSRLVCNSCHFVASELMGNVVDQICPHCNMSLLEKRLGDTVDIINNRLHTYRTKTEQNYRSQLVGLPTFFCNTDRSLDDCFIEYTHLFESKEAFIKSKE